MIPLPRQMPTASKSARVVGTGENELVSWPTPAIAILLLMPRL
jgi:hypothetical protein